jgi:hypothetical protein
MRFTSSSRAAILSALLTAVATPAIAQSRLAAAHPSAAIDTGSPWAGVYRLRLTNTKGQTTQLRLIVERVGHELSGTLISDDNTAAHVDLALDGDAIKASARTSAGDGTMLLRETSEGIEGTFVIGKLSYTVSGRRSA